MESHIDNIELSAESFQLMQDIVFRDVSEGMERPTSTLIDCFMEGSEESS